MKILEITYYLTNFEYLLNFITKSYKQLLNTYETTLIQQFFKLSEPARCLYVRMCNRKGVIFKISGLQYQEIPSTQEAAHELMTNHFVTQLSLEHETHFADLLTVFTKKELLGFMQVYDFKLHKANKNLKINEIYYVILTNISYSIFLKLADNHNIIIQNYNHEISFFKFLFFGNSYQNMTDFVMRDMGMTKFEDFDETKFTPLFQTRAEAEEKWAIIEAHHTLNAYLETANTTINYTSIETFFKQWFLNHALIHETSANAYQRLAIRLGEVFEKQKFTPPPAPPQREGSFASIVDALPSQKGRGMGLEIALQFYEHAIMPPARERQCRILATLSQVLGQVAGNIENNIQKALLICEQIMANPQNANELSFATDFSEKLLKKNLKTKEKTLKMVTKYLKEAQSIYIEITHKHAVENGVVTYFQQQGFQGIFVENYAWRAIFALVFWDIIFDFNIHNPLQKRPSDFYTNSFFEKRKSLFINHLENIMNKELLQKLIEKNYHEKYNFTNSFMQWHESILPLATLFIELLPLEGLKMVLLEMAKDMHKGLTGFPDVLIWNETEYCLIEVKSPTDTLSAQQLFWLNFFEKNGIKAKVLKVIFQEKIL